MNMGAWQHVEPRIHTAGKEINGSNVRMSERASVRARVWVGGCMQFTHLLGYPTMFNRVFFALVTFAPRGLCSECSHQGAIHCSLHGQTTTLTRVCVVSLLDQLSRLECWSQVPQCAVLGVAHARLRHCFGIRSSSPAHRQASHPIQHALLAHHLLVHVTGARALRGPAADGVDGGGHVRRPQRDAGGACGGGHRSLTTLLLDLQPTIHEPIHPCCSLLSLRNTRSLSANHTCAMGFVPSASRARTGQPSKQAVR